MNQEPFEERVAQQEFRRVPVEWRQQLLSTAARSKVAQSRDNSETVLARLRALLWPSTSAWASLAVVWLMIAALHFASGGETRRGGNSAGLAAPAVLNALQEQRRVLAEITDAVPAPALRPPKPLLPGSRSEGSALPVRA